MGCNFKQRGFGLKDKLKVIFMVENWFLELNYLSGKTFFPHHSLLCVSWDPHSMSIMANVTVLCSR